MCVGQGAIGWLDRKLMNEWSDHRAQKLRIEWTRSSCKVQAHGGKVLSFLFKKGTKNRKNLIV